MRSAKVRRSAQAAITLSVATAATLLTVGTASAAPAASGSPTTGLKDGSNVSLSGSGWAAGANLYILECSNTSGQAGCDTSHLKTATTTAGGAFTASFSAYTGAVGNGTCKAGSSNCFIAVSDGTAANSAQVKLSFAAAAAPATAAPTAAPTAAASAAPTDSTSSSGSTTPTSVAAGSGGGADRQGPSTALLVLAGLGGVAVIGGTLQIARRRR